jgi:coproporphyrinogen III oxidase-like Fe-S oxidoreductase
MTLLSFSLKNRQIAVLPWWQKIPMQIAKKFIITHCYIHKIDKMFVNMRTREVTLKVNNIHERPLTKYSGGGSRFYMSQEAFERLQTILRTKEEENHAAAMSKG